MGLFRLLLYVFFVYMVYRLIRIIFLPLFFKNNPFGNQQRDNFEQPKRKKEGETTIKHIPENNRNLKQSNDSDYVDYEEID